MCVVPPIFDYKFKSKLTDV
uniref:Uncharacterized protein n=1 Tax=Anguilla anguilla TaxID=7936 RepID=A0A0E9PI26_ANGAN